MKLLRAHPYVGDAGTSYPDPKNPKVTIYVSHVMYTGKDDLKSIYPYYVDEWSRTYSPDKDVPWSEKEYLANPAGYSEKIRQLNEDYIAELQRTKRYLEPYVIRIRLMFNAIFDSPHTPPAGASLESYRMIFLDTDEYDGESNIINIKQK